MTSKKVSKVALIGNPNSGKTSLFNLLTGLRQKVGNYPGVTVDKKIGFYKLTPNHEVQLIDFPGIYSLYPNSSDEKIVIETLTNQKSDNFPDAIVYVIDSLDAEKHFLLATQLRELGIPMMVVFSMNDVLARKGIQIDTVQISNYLECPVISISSRTKDNIGDLLNKTIDLVSQTGLKIWSQNYQFSKKEKEIASDASKVLNISNSYMSLLHVHHSSWLPHVKNADKDNVLLLLKKHGFDSLKFQIRETMLRYNNFSPVLKKAISYSKPSGSTNTSLIDGVTTHRIFGPLVFLLIMLLVFQAIFSWAEWPMTLIENAFISLGSLVNNYLPHGWFSDMITEGVIAGLGGIMVFIPQIAILFFLIYVLEEIGYMSRAVFMFDGLMQRFGLNGRSIVALISGGACAIPAIMSTRTISNWKERLITILVTPLISCSARIPVYTVLIGFVVSDALHWGPFNAQGLAFMALYIIGIFAALGSALVFKLILKSDEASVLMIELPKYKRPLWNNVFLNVKEKVGTFVVEAGKVILVISIILWFLVSYGPAGSMQKAEQEGYQLAMDFGVENDPIAVEDFVASKKMEGSYAGIIGKGMEPAIRPLGFDWKIGIALLTSFAAREVFIGTMATIYSVGSNGEQKVIKERMAAQVHPATGKPVYSFATSLSLLLFYVFALQCMSTLAITKRETKSWKWPIIQFVFMGALAYLSSFIVYQTFS